MLTELSITNFAIIDKLRVSFAPGLNVLTGETGAGKSIVIDAVEAVLGGKAPTDLIRTGSDQAHVEGVFFVEDQATADALAPLLEENGLALEDGALILSRDLFRSGRSVARVNGRAVPVSVLQRIGQLLVDIHGQSEHLSLLQPAYQLDLLDDYAGTRQLRSEVAAAVTELRRVRRELERLSADERELARRADLLRFQVNEIQASALVPGEDEELERERTMLANAEKLAAAADQAYQALYGGTDELPSAVDRLGEALTAVMELAKIDAEQQAQVEAINAALFQLEDVARTLQSYRDTMEFNPERLQAVEERLDLLFGLKRKYGNTIEEIIAYGAQAAAELDALTHSEERRQELLEEEERLVRQAGKLAQQLSEKRKAAAVSLEKQVVAELADLNMKHSRFELAFEVVPDPNGVPLEKDLAGQRYACDTTGVDRVTFLLSPNPGEPLKPLARIASGGEMSRVMLALKTVLSRADRIGTLIFDEVDVGIGGRSGRIVGEKMARIAATHQVVCVTHLPQIASYADSHFRIAKFVEGERTATQVEQLPDEQRIEELAVMLAGTETSATARSSAAEMIRAASEWKRQNRVAVDSATA